MNEEIYEQLLSEIESGCRYIEMLGMPGSGKTHSSADFAENAGARYRIKLIGCEAMPLSRRIIHKALTILLNPGTALSVICKITAQKNIQWVSFRARLSVTLNAAYVMCVAKAETANTSKQNGGTLVSDQGVAQALWALSVNSKCDHPESYNLLVADLLKQLVRTVGRIVIVNIQSNEEVVSSRLKQRRERRDQQTHLGKQLSLDWKAKCEANERVVEAALNTPGITLVELIPARDALQNS